MSAGKHRDFTAPYTAGTLPRGKNSIGAWESTQRIITCGRHNGKCRKQSIWSITHKIGCHTKRPSQVYWGNRTYILRNRRHSSVAFSLQKKKHPPKGVKKDFSFSFNFSSIFISQQCCNRFYDKNF